MRTILTLSVLAVSPALALGQVLTPLSQNRTIAAQGATSGGSDAQSDAATDFGLFDSNVSVGLPGFAMAGASQASEILANGFTATGDQSSSSGGGSGASSNSTAEIVFQIDVKCTYTVEGFIEGFDGGFGEWNLWTDTNDFLDGFFGIAKGSFDIGSSGTLDPGTYRVNAIANGGGGFSFSRYDFSFELTPLAENYCASSPNSVGAGTVMGVTGSQSVAANDFHLESTGGLPNGAGLYFYGGGQAQIPFGDGLRCVGGMTFRLNPPIQTDAAGFSTRRVNFNTAPAASGAGAITAGSTWNFQLWYRDPMGPGGTGFNMSDGLAVTFCE